MWKKVPSPGNRTGYETVFFLLLSLFFANWQKTVRTTTGSIFYKHEWKEGMSLSERGWESVCEREWESENGRERGAREREWERRSAQKQKVPRRKFMTTRRTHFFFHSSSTIVRGHVGATKLRQLENPYKRTFTVIHTEHIPQIYRKRPFLLSTHF